MSFEIDAELAASTDRILGACDNIEADLKERRKTLLSILQQCANPDVDSAALALHHLLKGVKAEIFPLESAVPLAHTYLNRIANDVELLEVALRQKQNKAVLDALK